MVKCSQLSSDDCLESNEIANSRINCKQFENPKSVYAQLVQEARCARPEQCQLRLITQRTIDRFNAVRMLFIAPIDFQSLTCCSILFLLSVHLLQHAIQDISYFRNECNFFDDFFVGCVTNQFTIRSTASSFDAFTGCNAKKLMREKLEARTHQSIRANSPQTEQPSADSFVRPNY